MVALQTHIQSFLLWKKQGVIEIISYYYILPFAASVPVSYLSRKAGYAAVIISSLLLLLASILSFTYLSSFTVISTIAWISVSLFSLTYGKKYGKWLAPLFSLSILGMVVILTSYTYLQFLAGWEVMSIAAYAIIGLNRKDNNPPFIFMSFSEFSTVFIIAGAAYSYYLTGTVDIVSVNSIIPSVLFTIGAMVKMGMVPFMISEWLPIAHGNAPSNASAILSSTMTLMGVFGIVEVMLLSPISVYFGIFLIAIGVMSVIFASLFAYVSENSKMLAGFSTVESNGVILSSIGFYMIANTPLLREFALATIVVFALSHSISKSLIFSGIGASGVESFSEKNPSGDSKLKAGMLLGTASMAGLFPTIGGLGTWMMLEMFFMGAVEPGFLGIISIAAGSLLALGEGFAFGAMMKVLRFTSMGSGKARIDPVQRQSLYFMGILLVATFAVSPFFMFSVFMGGVPSVLVFNGLTIESMYNGTDFGLISPDYILALISIFTVSAIAIFGRPTGRTVPVWNNGRDNFDPYNSYAYSNNIRIMLKKILRTDMGHNTQRIAMADVFWIFTVQSSKAYRRFARWFTLKIMNSSIRWYMIYMVVAFIFVLLVARFAN